jgi:DNA invertase Pin-like site-specific DNA recombinase
LGLKGSLNEYELDLLRQRSLSARHEKARRGEFFIVAPIGFIKVGDTLEKDPDQRVQASIPGESGERFSRGDEGCEEVVIPCGGLTPAAQ